jgi:hypothetical protein
MEDYVKRYGEACEIIKEELPLPAVNEKLLIIFKSGQNAEGDFLGFDFERIVIREKLTDKSASPDLDKIQDLKTPEGKSYNPEAINKFGLEGRIPFLSAIKVMTARKIFSAIPMNEVSEVMLLPDKPDQIRNIIVITIGIVLIAWLIYGLTHMGIGPGVIK